MLYFYFWILFRFPYLKILGNLWVIALRKCEVASSGQRAWIPCLEGPACLSLLLILWLWWRHAGLKKKNQHLSYLLMSSSLRKGQKKCGPVYFKYPSSGAFSGNLYWKYFHISLQLLLWILISLWWVIITYYFHLVTLYMLCSEDEDDSCFIGEVRWKEAR